MQERNVTIKLGLTKTCLSESTVAVLNETRSKTKTVKRVLQTPFGEVEKKFVLLNIEGVARLADLITGTLYDAETGRCLATPHLTLVMEN